MSLKPFKAYPLWLRVIQFADGDGTEFRACEKKHPKFNVDLYRLEHEGGDSWRFAGQFNCRFTPRAIIKQYIEQSVTQAFLNGFYDTGRKPKKEKPVDNVIPFEKRN